MEITKDHGRRHDFIMAIAGQDKVLNRMINQKKAIVNN